MKRSHQILVIIAIALPVLVALVSLAIGIGLRDRGISPLYGRAVGVVRVADVIYSSEPYLKQLQEFRKDNSIAGVVLRIESPGGAVAPSQEIYSEVLRYRNTGKPLIVSMGNMATSGGYYIAGPAERIFANPGTITGSIGVIFQFPQYHELMEKIGIKIETVKAGKYKDMFNPHRSPTDREREHIQVILDDTHEQFIRDISVARSMELEAVRKVADGRIFTGSQAYDLDLVDTLGGFTDAVDYLKQSTGLPENARIVEKKEREPLLPAFLSQAFSRSTGSLFRGMLPPAGCYFLLEQF